MLKRKLALIAALMYILIAVQVNAGCVADGEMTDVMVLVNREHRLPEGYTPSNLVYVGNGQRLREDAAAALFEMHSAMNEEGLYLTMRSGYRSYAAQRNIFYNHLNVWGLASTERWVARPGHSEHQTGLGIDLVQRGFTGSPLSSARFQYTPHFAWLRENAYRYGFILRYPQGSEPMTGIAFEPWHWRYIGAQASTHMREEGFIVFEAYLIHLASIYCG